jgi:carbamoyl-phosphate synthase small subunit
MTGYQETLTDPSYHQQVVVMTAPHIGNTGMNAADNESTKIWVAGFVVRNPSPITSNWRSEQSLDEVMREQGIVGISGVDTRALTRHLRDRGAMRVGIFSDLELSREEMVIEVRKSKQMSGSFLSADVSTPKSYVVPATTTKKRFTVVALDLGIKSATPKAMSLRGIETHVLPYNATYEEITSLNPDGVFLSNGPGDPSTMTETVNLVRELLTDEIPIFGICFGHQILGRALGFETYKLQFGHRGINQPVIDKRSGKVEITSHNHGFAIEAPVDTQFTTVFGPGQVTHVCLNDGVVEGLELLDRGAFSVQYHPEAAAGPHDAAYLFDDFVSLMEKYPRKVSVL